MYRNEDPFYDDVQKFVKQSTFSANPILCENSAASQSNSRRSFLTLQLDCYWMAGVLGMLDLLRLTPLTPEQAGFVRVMQGSAEGLMQVLNEILDFSRIQSGHLSLDVVDFHIGELLDQVCY